MVDIVYLDFSKAFEFVSRRILTDKVVVYELDGQIVRWTENRLNG